MNIYGIDFTSRPKRRKPITSIACTLKNNILPRLRKSGVSIPRLQGGDPDRITVEAYPGLLARKFIGRRSYKQDMKAKQTHDQHEARLALFSTLTNTGAYEQYGIRIKAPQSLVDDPGGDALDALLCAVQAAWAWTRREQEFGMPPGTDLLEGWIADPALTP